MSGLKIGDRVVLVRDVSPLDWGGRVLCAGLRGTLGKMYRVQQGRQIWPMWLDEAIGSKRLVGVNDLDVRKVDGDKRD